MMTEHLKTLIRILSDGQFHSGEELGKILGQTRSAVWKLAQQFPQWDIALESRTNKGYRIPGGLSLLDAGQIKQYVPIEPLEILDVISSTNDYLKIPPSPPFVKGGIKVCFAEKQTAGRGRFGRQWVSPYARNIYLSVLYPFQKDPSQLSGLSLAIAVAVIEALQDYGINEGLGLKWPNDIFWKNKKLGGILIELSGETHSVSNAVIGIGLNVHRTDVQYADIATIIDSVPDRNKMAGLLLKHVLATLKLFDEKGFKPFREKWQKLDISRGKSVKIVSPTKEIIGIGRGIDENGLFLLEDADGMINSFSGGEVSLRF